MCISILLPFSTRAQFFYYRIVLLFIILFLLFNQVGKTQLSLSPCPPPNPCANNNCPSIPPTNFPGPAGFTVSNTSPNVNQTVQVQIPSQQPSTFSGAGCNNALINGLEGSCTSGNSNVTTCRTFNWNFGAGASPATATGIGPHNVSWPTCGPRTVTLTVCEHRPNGSAITDGNNCCAAGGKTFNIYVSGTPGTLTAAQAAGMSANVHLPYPVIPSFTYDLRLYLISPDCKILRLAGWSGYCGNAPGGYNATFQDGPGTELWYQSNLCEPYTGTFPPVSSDLSDDCGIEPTISSFAGFAGSPATGTWKFLILDGIGGGEGYLQSATINIPGFTSTTFTSNTVPDFNEPNTEWGPPQTCSYTYSMVVNVGGGPAMANFTAPAGPLCVGGAQQTFQPQGGGVAGVIYTWNFGAGANPQQTVTSTGPHTINVNWTTSGTKTISLTADGGGPGCISTTTATVVVNPAPQPSLSASLSAVCPSTLPGNSPGAVTTISLTSATNQNNTYTWSFDGGTQSPATTNGTGPYQVSWTNNTNPPAAQVKTITLTETAPGCAPVTASIQVTVNPTPIASLQAVSPVCSGALSVVSFNGTLGPTGPHVYTWDCDGCNGGNPSGAGPHNVSWTVNATTTKTITL
ncbi:MAG: PKD domain-containing protein, partial [Bacteroidia bacterium]|nr:PKD domain-containing protein [Bacteroidia bacterium]